MKVAFFIIVMQGPKANGNPGFDFGKALKGNNGASRPAHTGRGDGKFADGSLLAVKDGVCTIAPSAFDGENVAETLERLRHMGAFGSSASETSTADTSSSLQSRGGYKKGAFCEATTSKPAPSAGEPVVCVTSFFVHPGDMQWMQLPEISEIHYLHRHAVNK